MFEGSDIQITTAGRPYLVALRYGWTPKEFPCECVCGASFSVEHALSCNRGGFPTLRHNEVRDLTATLLTEVCTNVEVEPPLQELSGEVLTRSANSESGAHSDIAVDGFWEPGRVRTFCDIRVFNPFAPTNRKPSLFPLPIKLKRRRRNVNIIRELQKLNMAPFHLWFSPLLAAWVRKRQFSIRDWLLDCQTIGTTLFCNLRLAQEHSVFLPITIFYSVYSWCTLIKRTPFLPPSSSGCSTGGSPLCHIN